MSATMEQPHAAEQITPGTAESYTYMANAALDLLVRLDGYADHLKQVATQTDVDTVDTAEQITPGTPHYYAAMADQLFKLVGDFDERAAQLQREAAALSADNVMSRLERLSTSDLEGEASLTPLFIGFAGSETEQVLEEVNHRFGMPDLREMPAQIVSGPAGEESSIVHELGLGAGIKLRLALEREPDGREVMLLSAYRQEQTMPERPAHSTQQERQTIQPEVQAAVDTAMRQFNKLSASDQKGEAASTTLFSGFVDNEISEPALDRIHQILGIADLRTTPPRRVDGSTGKEPSILYEYATPTGIVLRLEVEKALDGKRAIMYLSGYKQAESQI